MMDVFFLVEGIFTGIVIVFGGIRVVRAVLRVFLEITQAGFEMSIYFAGLAQ